MKKFALLAVVAAALLLAGCGGSDDPAVGAGSSSTEAASDHNDADVSFAQQMIAHHRQAIDMAEMALEKGESAEVKALAQRIRDAQQPEITEMTDWLESWGAETDGDMDGMDGMEGMDEGSMGMMSEADMKSLEAASGAEFDRLFLEGMIKHHQGAVTMAQDELDDGSYGPAKELARSIIDAQTKEIKEMEALLGDVSP